LADMIELSAQYRMTGAACREKLREAQHALAHCTDFAKEMELRREITMLTAMSRDCTATANYLRSYAERREALERRRRKST
jgi:hypothetical protein